MIVDREVGVYYIIFSIIISSEVVLEGWGALDKLLCRVIFSYGDG